MPVVRPVRDGHERPAAPRCWGVQTSRGAGTADQRPPRPRTYDPATRRVDQRLHRSRIVYTHEVDTVAEVHAGDPTEEHLPPILLLADATARHQRSRIAVLLAQGQRLDIHGVLLGAWPDGDTGCACWYAPRAGHALSNRGHTAVVPPRPSGA